MIRCGYFRGDTTPPGCKLLLRELRAITTTLEQARREYGAFGSLSGETLEQMTRAVQLGRKWAPVDADLGGVASNAP